MFAATRGNKSWPCPDCPISRSTCCNSSSKLRASSRTRSLQLSVNVIASHVFRKVAVFENSPSRRFLISPPQSLMKLAILFWNIRMPVVVLCRCGKRFAAQDHLIGRQVPCPACGKSLAVAPGGSAATPGIVVTCACGRAFLAQEAHRGRQANCPTCNRVIQVPTATPATEPLELGNFAAEPAPIGQASFPAPSSEREAEIPWETLKLILGGGVLLLVVFAIVLTTVNFLRRGGDVADSGVATTPAEDQPPSTAAPASPSASLPPSSASGSGSRPPEVPPPTSTPPTKTASEPQPDLPFPPVQPQRANVTAKSAPAASTSSPAALPDAAQQWHNQSSTLSGIRRVNASDPPIAHFSWLTSLLPFLGHKQLYDQFDFQKPIDGKNLQLGGALIPEFLNPLDNNQRWRGYPFPGIALTHFVGISGVEDARNVVAAKLPRTDPRSGVFGYDEVAKPKDITDGQSQTAMIAGAGALANPWIFGGGATIRGAREPLFDKNSGLGTKGLPGGGSIVVMADGSVRHVSANVDPRVFKAMSTIHGAESVDLQQAGDSFDLQSLGPHKSLAPNKTN